MILEFLVIPAIVVIALIALYLVIRYRSAISAAAKLVISSSDNRQQLDAVLSFRLLGQQFVRVAALYDKMTEERLLSVDEARKWAIFVKHSKTAYGDAFEFWKTARQTQRRDLLQRAMKAFDDLVVPLSEFEAQAYKRLISSSEDLSPPSLPSLPSA